MSEKKTGVISIISKFSGIKFEGEDDWYNPVKSIKDLVLPEFKKKSVEIELLDGKKQFSSIKMFGGIPNPVMTKTDSPPNFVPERPRPGSYEDRIEFDRIRHKEIKRNGLLNTANEIIKNTISLSGKTKEITADQMTDLSITITRKLLDFVEE